ncbi:MAG TPA: aldo/keto reductase [Jiangellaceae bacterium]|nr:aldo/keto reductase [Jiangellaceae bacterium]
MRFGFGCVNLGSASSGRSWASDVRLVEQAIDLGVRVFDTADVYGSGSSERILGRATRGLRDELVIATKAGYTFRPRTRAEQSARRLAKAVLGRIRRAKRDARGGLAGGGAYAEQDFSAANLRRAVEDSLRRLQTDHVDVLQLHGPHHVEPRLFDQLQDLVTSGKVLRLGVGAESVDDALAWMAVDGLQVAQLPFGLLDPEAAERAFPEAARHSVELWARGVLGGGLFAAAENDPEAVRTDPKWPLIDGLRRLAAQSGVDVFRLAIGYVRSFPDVSTLLVGIGTPAHLRRNLDAMAAPPLGEDVLASIHALLHEHRGAARG